MSIEIQAYSAKGLVLKGATEEQAKQVIAELGGNVCTQFSAIQGGWVFSRKREDKIRAIVQGMQVEGPKQNIEAAKRPQFAWASLSRLDGCNYKMPVEYKGRSVYVPDPQGSKRYRLDAETFIAGKGQSRDGWSFEPWSDEAERISKSDRTPMRVVDPEPINPAADDLPGKWGLLAEKEDVTIQVLGPDCPSTRAAIAMLERERQGQA